MSDNNTDDRASKTRALLWLAVLCLLLRVAFWFIYAPIVFPDSPGYESLALQLRTLSFEGYNGARSPGYPLLLLVAGGNHRVVWLIQSLMGIGLSLMLFELAFSRTKSIRASFLIGLSYALAMNLLFFEASLLSESLSTFLVVLAVWLTVQVQRTGPKKRILYYLFLGVVLGLAALTRPLLVFMVPLYVFYFLYRWSRAGTPVSRRLGYLLGMVIPAAVMIVGWSLFNEATVSYFGITTSTGYNLTQHSGGFIELAPEKYATLKEIYLRHREEKVAESGWQTMTIWRAYPEMLRATGLSYPELSQELTRMSVGLFLAHPGLYAESVARAWVSFWRAPIYWLPDRLHPAAIGRVLEFLWFVERLLLVGINFLFLVISAVTMYALIVHRRVAHAFDLFVISIVLCASLFQALVEYGENGRYALPFQPLVMLIVFLWFWGRLGSLRRISTSGVSVANDS